VNEYLPQQIHREDGKTVLRERRVVQCPERFRLRKDEIHGEMKHHKTENWQDGKFFVVEAHAIGAYIHPAKAKMEKTEKEKKDAELDAKRVASEGDKKPIVAWSGDATNDSVCVGQSP
jgi:hypothetical protein